MAPFIDTLPDEILAHIFVLHSEALHEKWRRGSCKTSSVAILPDTGLTQMMNGEALPQMIPITYICRRWRDVAVGCPEFWSFIIASSPATTAKLLELSKQAPLTIFCMISGDSLDTTKWRSLRLVLKHLHRVQSLTLLIRSSYPRIPARSGFDALYENAHTPLLESFSVHAIANPDDPPAGEVAQKIGQLWDAPKLRHFSTYGGKDPFDCTQATEHPVLRWRDTLTTFAWFPKTNHHDQLRGSAQMLLQVIRQLPHLQTLQLSFSPSYATEPIKPLSERARFQPISIPALRRLVLRGHLQSCFDILDHLTLPHHLDQLSVMAQNAEPAYHVEATPLTDHLVELLSQGSETLHEPHATAGIPITRSMRTLCIRSHNREATSFEILASSKLLQPGIDERFPLRRGLHPVPFEGMYPDLELCLTLPTSITRRHFARLFQGTSLCDAEVLQVMGRAHCFGGEPPEPLQSTWSLDVMSHLNNIHTLFIDSPVDPELLTQYLSPSMGGQNPQHNFPRLRHVYCTQIACEPLRQITSVLSQRGSIDEEYYFAGTFVDLITRIQERVNSGVPIESLKIVHTITPMTKAEMVALRQFIPQILIGEIDKKNRLRKDNKMYSVPRNLHDVWELVEDSAIAM